MHKKKRGLALIICVTYKCKERKYQLPAGKEQCHHLKMLLEALHFDVTICTDADSTIEDPKHLPAVVNIYHKC